MPADGSLIGCLTDIQTGAIEGTISITIGIQRYKMGEVALQINMVTIECSTSTAWGATPMQRCESALKTNAAKIPPKEIVKQAFPHGLQILVDHGTSRVGPKTARRLDACAMQAEPLPLSRAIEGLRLARHQVDYAAWQSRRQSIHFNEPALDAGSSFVCCPWP